MVRWRRPALFASRLPRWLRRPWVVALAGAAALASCSVLVETRSQQCQADADCSGFTNGACDLDSHTCVDKRELACKLEGCVCDPVTPTDVLNTCTDAERHCFDNDALPLDGGQLPDPPGGNPGTGGAKDRNDCPSGAGGAAGTGGAGTGGVAAGGGGGGPTVQICEDLPSPVFTIGPTSIKPLLSWVAKLYAKQDVTVIYQDDSSCVAVDKLYGGSAHGRFMENDGGNEEWTTYFDAQGAEHPCRIVDGSILPHIGLSDVFPQSCGYDLNHNDKTVKDQAGPVQAFGFIVPSASTQESISFEAAYLAYAFGDDSGVTPWNERKYIYERDEDSGTQAMMAALLKLDPTEFRATLTTSSTDEALLVACSEEPEKTIGILAADLVKEHVADVKLLAYQHREQTCGYLPDSTRGANDLANVRDGHYFIWAPVHLLTHAGENNQDALTLIKYVSGILPPPPDEEEDLFDHWVDAHLVPQCAMRVTRDEDAGDLRHLTPDDPCSCRYDEAVNKATTCDHCTGPRPDCPICGRDGFCEPP